MHLFRKLLIGVALWFITFSACAQSEGSRTISWRTASPSPVSAAASSTNASLSFQEASYPDREAIPYYVLSVPGVAVSSFEFTQVNFTPLTTAELGSISKKSLKTELQPIIQTGTANRVQHSTISFQPFRLNPQTGVPEKLVSFNYRYTTGSSTYRTGSGTSANKRTYASRSVLSSGDWYKIGVPADGIYKLDRAALQALGINVSSLNPKNLRLFGNGGGMLPQANSASRPDDLVENAIWVEGEQDNSFDAADYVLFYGQGPHTWVADPSGKAPFVHSFNLYSDTTYYYLNLGSSAGLRIGQQASVQGSFPVIQSFNERWFHEVDSKNMLISGREWYGEEFSTFATTKSFSISATDLVPGSTVHLTSAVMGNSPNACSFTVKLNNVTQGTHSINGRGSYSYHLEGINHLLNFSQPLTGLSYSNTLEVSYTFNPGSSASAIGYLNYFDLFAERQLKLYGNQTSFRSLTSVNQAVSTYQVGNVTATAKIWNVTNPLKPIALAFTFNNGSAVFSAASNELKEYVVFQGFDFPSPTLLGKLGNQNLHSLNLDGQLDLVILAHPAFLSQAQRLASHRKSASGLQVEVVSLPNVYEEFSSGKQDVTAIRDFMKMLYERSTKQGDDQLNLLLLGDASYDPKRRLSSNTNFIPVYQSRQSLDPVLTYSSEDYYGFLDDTEGEWSETNFNTSHLLDIGIGRLPAKTSAEADLMVDKIIRYESAQSRGDWRNNLTFLADDGDANEHLLDAEYLAELVEAQHPEFRSQKLYLDLFPQVSVPNGKRSPETNQALQEAVEKGTLLINYTGHGNEVSLAEEQILTNSEILAWNNPDKLTFFITATCEFGRYDDPSRNSGAETALLHPAGGAVGMLTTTRPVYSSGNRLLNAAFFSRAFQPLSSGAMPSLGYLLKATKNSSAYGVNNRNFTLLGDPSMKLAYPVLDVSISTINGKSLAQTDTLHALSKVTIEGAVQNGQQIASDFQGKVHLAVYDKRSTIKTLGDESSQQSIPVRNNLIYSGVATVKNGLYTVSFVIPKDINYQIGAGNIYLYAQSANTDANGSASLPIGGADPTATADNTPPQIQLYLNDESFISGGIVNAEATLLAHLSDENGINTARAGIGHEITATIDGQTANPYILNDFYTADVDSYQSGKVRYSLKNLSLGPHTLQLKAWDTHNNSSTTSIDFIVASSEKLALNHVFNIPNPFINTTTFHFDHNRPGQELDILIQIFTVAGKLVKSLHAVNNGETHFSDLMWDGRDDYGDILAKGVYIYNVKARSRMDGATTSHFEKLVLLK